MKKIFLLLALLTLSSTAMAKVNVVGTLPLFTSLAQEIGGHRINTKSLAKPNQDPHFLDAKPSYVVALNRADLLLHNGLELETGWLPPILQQARNNKIMDHTPGNVDLSQGLHILEIPQGRIDRSMGDVHPGGNPHTWFDPNNIKIMAVQIAKHLAKIDPAGEKEYNQNLKSFIKKLNRKIYQWKRTAAKMKGKKIISYHKSLSYLAYWTRLDIVDYIEPKPGIPPSSKHVDHLLNKIPHLNVKAILMESFYPKKIPQYIAKKTNIPLIQIPYGVGEKGTKNYFEFMDHLMTMLGEIS